MEGAEIVHVSVKKTKKSVVFTTYRVHMIGPGQRKDSSRSKSHQDTGIYLLREVLVMSLIYKIKRSNPRIDPWGISVRTGDCLPWHKNY